MITKHITDTFKSTFEEYFADKEIKWCNGCFAGYKNGLFYYAGLISKSQNHDNDIDIIFRILPDFYVDEETLQRSKNCIFTIRTIASVVGKPVLGGKEHPKRFFTMCLELLESEYDRLFLYTSITDFADKVIVNCNLLLEYEKSNPEFSNISGEFPSIDFTLLAVYSMKYHGNQHCGNIVMNLISTYKVLIYNRIKQGNSADLRERLDKSEQAKMDSLFTNYNKLSRFAEAMLENNNIFFAEAEKDFSVKKLLGKAYIKKFISCQS